ncbi:MAG: GNAT family N-acetyltransferase [Bacteroidota bacterium]
MEISIRKGLKADLHLVLDMIQELAAYEKAPQEVTVTLNDLEKDGFGENPLFEFFLAFDGDTVAGMAFYFFSYSTWKGKCIYLEDIVVKNEFRGKNIGRLLFEAVILKSKEYGANRMQWQVLDWNEPAIHFYQKFDAVLDNTWINGKLTKEQIQNYPFSS